MADQEKVRLSVSLPADLHAELQRWADRHERSLSREIVYALRVAVVFMPTLEFSMEPSRTVGSPALPGMKS